MSEWRVLSPRGVRVMSLSVPQPTAEQRPLAASLVPAGFFCRKIIFSLGSQSLIFLSPFESIWENKRRQVAYLVCLCNPSSPLMGFSFLLWFLLVFFFFFYLSLSSAHRLVKSLLTSSFSRVSSGERLLRGARHTVETVYCTFCNQSCFILYIQIDIYAHDVIWFTCERGRGWESWCVCWQKDSDGTQKWIETMWVLFLGFFRFSPLQVVVNNLRLILTGWCMNLIDPPRRISSDLCDLCSASSVGQRLTLAQNWVSTSRPRKSNFHKICSEYLSSTCHEYLCWTLTYIAAHLCSTLIQWQGAINIAYSFFSSYFAVTLWPLLSGYPL